MVPLLYTICISFLLSYSTLSLIFRTASSSVSSPATRMLTLFPVFSPRSLCQNTHFNLSLIFRGKNTGNRVKVRVFKWHLTSKERMSLSKRPTIETCLHKSMHSSLISISSLHNFVGSKCIEVTMNNLQPFEIHDHDKYSSRLTSVPSLHVSSSILKADSISIHCSHPKHQETGYD